MDTASDLAVRETTFIDVEAEIGKRLVIYDERTLGADVSLAIGALAAMGLFAPAAGLRWVLDQHERNKIRLVYLHDRLTQTTDELEQERAKHLETLRQHNESRPEQALIGCDSEWSEYLDRETGVGAPIFSASGQQISGAPYLSHDDREMLQEILEKGGRPQGHIWVAVSDRCATAYLNQWGLICGYNRGEEGVGWRLTSRGLAVLGFYGSAAKVWRVKRGVSGSWIATMLPETGIKGSDVEDGVVRMGTSLADVRTKVMDWFKERKLPCLCVPAQPDAPDGLIESWM